MPLGSVMEDCVRTRTISNVPLTEEMVRGAGKDRPEARKNRGGEKQKRRKRMKVNVVVIVEMDWKKEVDDDGDDGKTNSRRRKGNARCWC